jgi:hypothetical protein
MNESDNKKEKGKSIFDSKGPMQIGAGGSGESHLYKREGHGEYTTGVPYQEEKYVSPVIGEDYKVPTDMPSSVRSGAAVAHMSAPGQVQVPVPSTYKQPAVPAQTTVFQGRWRPQVHPSAKIDPGADIRGNILIGDYVHIAAGTIISAHEDEPICLSRGCALFEGAVLTILPVRVGGVKVASRLVKVEGTEYPLFIGEDAAWSETVRTFSGRRSAPGP